MGGTLERAVVLQHPKKSGRNEVYMKELKRADSGIKNQIWMYLFEHYTFHNKQA